MTFKRYGNKALLVDFEQRIDFNINQKVIALKYIIEQHNISGIQFHIPAYCSLTIGFDNSITNYEILVKKIKALSDSFKIHTIKNVVTHTLPVCYEKGYAWDLEGVLRQTNISKQKLIELHTKSTFRVYMLGFLPGFPYLGTLPESLFCCRKIQPRLKVAAGSVGIAGLQTGVYPSDAPGGWQIIGRTPLKLFNPEKPQPFLFKVGDLVKFKAIDQHTYRNLK